MFGSKLNSNPSLDLLNIRFLIPALFLVNFLFNVLGNSSFKLSAQSANWRWFFYWQVIGNLSGLITVLTLTALFRFMPLHIAFPVSTGLAILGIQVLSSHFFFHERISTIQWLGTLLIVVGILMLSRK